MYPLLYVQHLLFSSAVSTTLVQKVEWDPLHIQFSVYLNNLKTPIKVYISCVNELLIMQFCILMFVYNIFSQQE